MINRRKDGTFYHEEMRITPVQNPSGEIVSYIAIKQDVTERRAAEEAQRFLAAIVDSSEDAIALTTAGAILTWNRGAEVISGYPPGRRSGRTCPCWRERLTDLAHFTEQILQRQCRIPIRGSVPAQGRTEVHVSVTGYSHPKRGRRSGSRFELSFATSRNVRRLSKPGHCWPRSWSLRTMRFTA